MNPLTGVLLNRPLSQAIIVWDFDDAPEELRKLSTNGGDEDWLALVPMAMAERYIGWLNEPAFGCCSVEDHFADYQGIRYKVVIGAHA